MLKIATAGVAVTLTEELLARKTNETNYMRKGKNMWHLTNFANAFENGEYVLPELPYDYDALKPLYDEQTLRIHHDKHHAGYVKKLNTAILKLKEARKAEDYSAIQALSGDLAFNGSGHVLHTLFWHSMKPEGNNGKIPHEFEMAFDESFGSAKDAQAQFAAATKAVEGSGWGILAFEPFAQKLVVLQCEKHQNLTMWGVIPLLVCDVWEHAYYLKSLLSGYKLNNNNWLS